MTSDRLPRAVLFDLDGTLADTEPWIAAGIVQALAEHGYEVTREQVLEVLGPPLTGMVQLLVGSVSDEEYRAIRAAYMRHYHEVQLPNVQPLPGANALLDALEARHVPLAIVTNKLEAGAHEQVDVMGWKHRFATVIGADTAARSKPAPDPALLALERVGVQASAAAFVGDTAADMQCAHAADIPLRIGLVHVRSEEEMRAAGATHLAHDLDEAGAVLLGERAGG